MRSDKLFSQKTCFAYEKSRFVYENFCFVYDMEEENAFREVFNLPFYQG